MREFLSIMIFAFGLCFPASADPPPGLDALRARAEQGDVAAQNQLGAMYSEGAGVARDDAEALKWYRKAAEQGNAAAQSSLGFFYKHGLGAPRNDAEAVKWYRKAADQGDADAQMLLGAMYVAGQGVPRDDVTAYMWFSLAAQGNNEAHATLDLLETQMTANQLAEAQRMAREWKPVRLEPP